MSQGKHLVIWLSEWHNAPQIIRGSPIVAKSTESANPFEFGRAMRADAIVDREEEMRRLTDAVRNGERLFLIGPRRYGKTSLLNYMQSQLETEGVIVLKYDVEKFETTRLLAKRC